MSDANDRHTTPRPVASVKCITGKSLLDYVHPRAIAKGISWVRAHALEPYGAARMSQLTDDALRAIGARLLAEEYADLAAEKCRLEAEREAVETAMRAVATDAAKLGVSIAS